MADRARLMFPFLWMGSVRASQEVTLLIFLRILIPTALHVTPPYDSLGSKSKPQSQAVMLTVLCIGLLHAVFNAVLAQLLPDSRALTVNELEHLYFDNTGPGGFLTGIEPCTNYVDSTTGLPNNTLGRQTSAQWLRVSFHDFVTADATAGTGGLDASIGFETLRAENVGTAFNDSLFFFSFFISAKVSMADLIALGTAMSVGVCGGPQIPLRVGRIDATGPGATGVPEPETDIKTTLSEFSGAGFNQADAIALTACGHTLGGVHHSTFPQIVGPSAIGPNNAGGRIAFDDTVANFDVNVAQQYLDGSGNGGGALVTTTNVTVQSDLRLYNSDKNATLEKLAQSSDQFRSTCATLLARMLNTVPRGVELTPPLDPTGVKHANISLNVDWTGQMTLSGFFRYIQTAGSAPAPSSLTISIINRNGHPTQTNVKATTNFKDKGTGVYGPSFQYPFTVSFPGNSGLSGVQVGNQRFPLTDSIFVVPALSSVTPGLATYNIVDPAHEFTLNITAAVS